MNDIAKSATPALKKVVKSCLVDILFPLQMLAGRVRFFDPRPRRFTGIYDTHAIAMNTAKANALAGYDHDEISNVSFEQMCKLAPWDYPILYWAKNLLPHSKTLLDAGGHMGTKYRAFQPYLDFPDNFTWIIYDVPAIVNAGRNKAREEGLTELQFVDQIEDCGPIDLCLGSGLLQYLDIPVSQLLGQLTELPVHILFNKVAFHRQGPLFTLERIGKSLVPYQMRNEAEFLDEMQTVGYELVDRWAIPSLAHKIDTHPELGRSENAGFYFRLITKN